MDKFNNQFATQKLRQEMSVTGGTANYTQGPGEQVPQVATKKVSKKKTKKEVKDVEPKYAAGKAKIYAKEKWGWKKAPSVPNRPSKGGFIYKQLFEELSSFVSRVESKEFNVNKVWDFIESRPFNNPNYMPKFKTAEEIWNGWGPEEKEMYTNFKWKDTYGNEIHPREKAALQHRANYDALAGLNEIDRNDPILMAMRATKDAPKPQAPQAKKANPNQAKINMLLKKRAEIERDMEQEAEPEGGPIADKYGDMLNKIDQAVRKLKGQGEWGPETNPYMDKGEIERRAAMMEDEPEEQDDDEDRYDWFTDKYEPVSDYGRYRQDPESYEKDYQEKGTSDYFQRRGLDENYSRFKNETKTRGKSDQFHQAVRQVKKKVQEINRLFEYVSRLKMELSEGEDGLKYKMHTEKALEKIKEMVSALNQSVKKFK